MTSRKNMVFNGVLAWSLFAAMSLCSAETVTNVRDLGAKGDGKADDTEYLQKAIDGGGEILIPSGTYLVMKTLNISKKTSLIMRGQGESAFAPHGSSTTIAWGGEKGGTLIKSIGSSGCIFQNMNLSGRTADRKKEDGRAGVLYSASFTDGYGNMLNKMENMGFYQADIGIEMGGEGKNANNSDMLFDFITFAYLNRGFVAKNAQAVNFTFNFLFAMDCGKVLDFEKGANLLVNSAQMTDCKLFLEIDNGGQSGLYQCNNVRIESGTGGKRDRYQLLRCMPSGCMANVKFTSYSDNQWAWFMNKTQERTLPLCEIGPGSIVTIENSIFDSPVASVTGSDKNPASLVLRECVFKHPGIEKSISANSHGFFKIINPVNGNMSPCPDMLKWPKAPAIELGAGEEYKGLDQNIYKPRNQYLIVGSDAAQTLITNLSLPEAWVGILGKGKHRVNNGPAEPIIFSKIPEMLLGKMYVFAPHENPSKPGLSCSFTSTKNATLYLFVGEKNQPAIPDGWTKTDLKSYFDTPYSTNNCDVIYTRKIQAGENVTIPANDRLIQGSFTRQYGLPHACAVVPEK